MTLESDVARHYTHGALERAIDAALAAAGRDPARLAPEDLAGIDEFHIGGRQATLDLAGFIPWGSDSRAAHVLDIGSGIGGPARTLALVHGARVTGIDLTEEYVRVATNLTARVGLAERVAFRVGSATDVPFAPGSFDGATMIHVGMNIADKARVFAEARRVLRPGGWFAVYDVMRTSDEPLVYPVPWASDATTSFVEPADAYRRHFEQAGFRVIHERGRRVFALEFFAKLRARAAEGGAGPPTLGTLMPDFPAKAANAMASLQAGRIEPTEMIGRLAG
jgi:ubiquinone/menaquinone biosynthesis C-methylase UbiE